MALTKEEERELAEIEAQIAEMERFEKSREKSKGGFREVQKEIVGEEPELLEAAKYGARAGGTLSYYDELLEDAEREEYLKEQARLSKKHPLTYGAAETAASAPYYAAGAMGGLLGTAAVGAIHGAGSGSDPVERLIGATASGAAGGLTHWLGGKIKKGYEDPSKIKAGALGSTKADWERVGTRNIETASENIDKAKGYKMGSRKFDFDKGEFVAAPFKGKGIGRKTTRDDYISRFQQATKDIHKGVRDILKKDHTIKDIRVTPDEVADEVFFREMVRDKIDILDEEEAIESLVDKQINIFKSRLRKRADANGELSLDDIYDEKVRWQNQVSRMYEKKEQSLSVPETNAKQVQEAIASGLKDYIEYRVDKTVANLDDAVADGTLAEELADQTRKNFGKIKEVNKLSSSIRTVTDAAKGARARESTRAGQATTYLPYGQAGLPNWAASMMDLNSPRALMRRSGESMVGAMGKQLGKYPIIKGAVETPIRQVPAMEARRFMLEGDPMSLEMLPDSEPTVPYAPDQSMSTPLPEQLMETPFPRSTDAILEKPNLFLAKVAQQTDNMDLVVQLQEAIKEPRKLDKVMPLIARQYPQLFEYSEFGDWNGKLIDPADRQLYTKMVMESGRNSYEKAEIIDHLNRTKEMLV